MTRRLGVYEKALPWHSSWPDFFALAGRSGYQFVELAIDESPERVARLNWPSTRRRQVRSAAAKAGVTIGTITLSAHRATPLGSADPKTRSQARKLTSQAIRLAVDLGADCVQIAGYFRYYEPPHPQARAYFLDGLAAAAEDAEHAGVTLGLENVDGCDVTSVEDGIDVITQIESSAVKLYIDVGNLAGNRHDVPTELRRGLPYAHAVQFKDARPDVFRRVPFGEGTVPWRDVMHVLNTASYTGTISIEMWNDQQHHELALAAARWFARLDRATR